MSEPNELLGYSLEYQFPHPIAAPYRCARTARNGAERAAMLLATTDGLLRYTAAIALADFFARMPGVENREWLHPALLHPTATRWAELVTQLCQRLDGKDPFMPELVRALVQKKSGGLTATGTALTELARQCDSLMADKELLLDLEMAGETAAELEPKLVDLLGHLAFLERYPLAQFRSHAASSEQLFRGFMVRWMGYRNEPLPVGVEFEGAVPLEVPLLVAPESNRALELAPFLKVLPGVGDGVEQLYLLAGLRTTTTLRLESFWTGRFQVTPLTAAGQPCELAEQMASWTGGARVVTLSPAAGASKRLQFKSALLPAEKVLEGRYKALGFIGRGGIGAVYRVFDLQEKTDKALKILYPDLSRNEFFTRYFLETGKAMSRLESDRLVPVFEAGYSSTLQENHILMAHMPGGSLGERLGRRETIPVKAALNMAVSIAEGLEAVHGGGLIHGGIHPGNILFDGEGKARLADFGILRLPSSRVTSFRPLERLHSLRYASPELLLGGQPSAASDLYSLAIVLYEMVTGRLPSKTDFVPPSELVFPLPEELDELLRRALAPAPESRFQSAAELCRALQAAEGLLGSEYDVSPTAQAQQLIGHLADTLSGHTELLDQEREEKMAAGDFEAAARLLQVKIDELWDTDERVFWMQELARLYLEQLDRPGKAVDILRQCLELAPDNHAAISAIIGHFEKTEQWEELSQLLVDLLEQNSSGEGTTPLLQKLVEVHCDKLQDAAQAAQYLEALIARTGPDRELLERLALLQELAEAWHGVAATLEQWLTVARPTDRVEILARLGGLYRDRLDDAERAIAAFERLLAEGGDRKSTRLALRTLYRAQFSYSSLSHLLEEMVASGDHEGQLLLELYQELGEIFSSYLYDSARAMAVWTDLLKLDPGHQTALAYLERLYLREGRHESYVEILERKARGTADAAARVPILLSAALARMEFLADNDGARKLLEEGLALMPGHEGTVAALERLYAEHGDIEALSHLMLVRLEREESAAGRLQVLLKLAAVFEQKGDHRAGFEVMKRACQEAPGDFTARAGVERNGEAAGAEDELIAFYMERVAAGAPDSRDYLAGRIVHYCGRLEDRGKALYALEKAAELLPDSVAVHRSLLVFYREAEKWDRLAESMMAALEGAGDGGQLLELFEEVALLIKNRLGKGTASQRLLARLAAVARRLAPRQVGPLLRESCRIAEEWGELAQSAIWQLEAESDPALCQELRKEIGEALVLKRDFAQARGWLEAALEKAPYDSQLQDRLEETLAFAEDWKGLVEFYARFIPLTTDVVRKRAFLQKAAEIQEAVFEELGAAIELYRQLHALVPHEEGPARSLAQALRKAGRFTELAWQYEQLAHRLEGEAKVALLIELGDLYRRELGNPDAAIQSLRSALRQSPANEELFQQVRTLCLEERRFETLLRLLAERSQQLEDEESRLLLQVEMAKVSADEMGLLPPARNYLEKVLQTRPGHAQAFAFYRELLIRQEDWKGLARLLARQLDVPGEQTDSAEVAFELADLYSQRLDLQVSAVEVLEKLWERHPESTRAALSLARAFARLARWDQTASMLAVVQKLSEQQSDAERHEALYLSALTYEALLQRPAAIDYFRRTREAGYQVAEVERRLVKLLYLDEQFEEGRELARKLLQEATLRPEERRELESQLADMDRRLGRLERSRQHLQSLLEQRPGDKELLAKLIELCRQEKDREGEIRYLDQLLLVEGGPEERFPLLVTLGNLLRVDEARRADAAAALEKALGLRPDSRAVAIALGEVYAELEQWDGAVAAFGTAEQAETAPARKAALAFMQGVLLHQAARSPEAIPHLRRCLELEPGKWDAFTLLEELLVAQSDWTGQRTLYEGALSRTDGQTDPDLLYRLNLNLGRILMERSNDSSAALVCLDRAHELKPAERQPVELRARLYLQSEEMLDRAVTEYRKLLAATPTDVSLLQVLRRTYAQMKRYDEAWYVAGVLELLGAASEKERAFYRQFASGALKLKPRVIDGERMRTDLMAEEIDWELSEIMRILFERMAGRLQLQTPKALGHSSKNQLSESDSELYGKLVAAITRTLGVPPPATHLRETSGWLVKEACLPPVLAMSPNLLEHRKGKHLRFDLARTLLLFLPHLAPVGIFDLDTLRSLLGNLLKTALPALPEPAGDPRRNGELRKEMERAVPAKELGQVRDLVGRLRDRGAELSVKRWLVGVEKTAVRFGFIFANDLAVADEMVRACPIHLSAIAREELVTDIIRFAVSEQFSRLRDHLGITIL